MGYSKLKRSESLGDKCSIDALEDEHYFWLNARSIMETEKTVSCTNSILNKNTSFSNVLLLAVEC